MSKFHDWLSHIYGIEIGSIKQKVVSLKQLCSGENLGEILQVNHFKILAEYLKTKDDNLLLMMISILIHIIDKQLKEYEKAPES